MSSIYDLLLNEADEQLDRYTGKDSSAWMDHFIDELNKKIDESGLAPQDVDLAKSAVRYLSANKESFKGMGKKALRLMIFQATLGQTDKARETYIRSITNAQELIDLMHANADGVVRAKRALDAKHQAIEDFFVQLGQTALSVGFRYVLPFVLAAI